MEATKRRVVEWIHSTDLDFPASSGHVGIAMISKMRSTAPRMVESLRLLSAPMLPLLLQFNGNAALLTIVQIELTASHGRPSCVSKGLADSHVGPLLLLQVNDNAALLATTQIEPTASLCLKRADNLPWRASTVATGQRQCRPVSYSTGRADSLSWRASLCLQRVDSLPWRASLHLQRADSLSCMAGLPVSPKGQQPPMAGRLNDASGGPYIPPKGEMTASSSDIAIAGVHHPRHPEGPCSETTPPEPKG